MPPPTCPKPNAASLTRTVSVDVWSGLVVPQHVYFYGLRALQRAFNRSGFDVVAVSTWDPWYGPPPAGRGAAVDVIARRDRR